MVLALHSKKKVVELFSKYKSEYDYVIITRPDQKYNTKLNINSLKLINENNIIIPFEHSYEGINDRFCIANPKNAITYGLAFNSLKNYSELKSIVTGTGEGGGSESASIVAICEGRGAQSEIGSALFNTQSSICHVIQVHN